MSYTKNFAHKQLRYNPYFYKKLKEVQNQATWSAEELLSYQNQRFVKLVRRAYHKSSFYKSLYDRYGVNIASIQSIEDAKALPLIYKQDIRDHIKQIFIGNSFNRTAAYTSGTTGNPTLVYRNYQSVVEENAYLWAHRLRFGHAPGMKTLVLRGRLKRKQFRAFDPFTNTLELSSYNLNEKYAQQYIHEICRFEPHAIFAYPSAAESLTNLFSTHTQHIHIPLIFTSSETLYPHQKHKIEQTFGGRVVDWYGNAERTIAIQQREDHLYEDIPTYSVNFYQENQVITTGLINHSFPLINYVVNDIIIPSDQYEDTKPGKTIIQRIQGRDDDLLVLPDGTKMGMIWGAVDRIPHLLYAQFVQDTPATFTVNIVVTSAFSSQDKQLLSNKIQEYVGSHVPFKIAIVGEENIIKSQVGKYKLVINNYFRADRESLKQKV